MPDSDIEIKGGGVGAGAGHPEFLLGLKIRGGMGPPGPSPGSANAKKDSVRTSP